MKNLGRYSDALDIPRKQDVDAVRDAIPTKTSQLTNDSNYATTGDLPTKTSDLTNDSGYITSAQAPVQSVAGKTGAVTLTKSDVGLGNVDNVKQYSASNPPPYPVTSVNGKTGQVDLSYDDVNALPSTTVIPKIYLKTWSASDV